MFKIIVLSIVFIFSLNAKEFTILTEEAKPFNYIEDGEVVGISADIVKEILKRVDHPNNIKILPWTKAYNATKDGSGYALFGTLRHKDREELFKWVGPLTGIACVLYAKKDSKIEIDSLEDAKKVGKIGVYKDDIQEQILKNHGFTNLESTINNLHNPIKLASGEIDLWANGDLSASGISHTASIDGSDFKQVFQYCDMQLYIAFSKDSDEEVLKKWQRALDEIIADGTRDKIHKKYQ